MVLELEKLRRMSFIKRKLRLKRKEKKERRRSRLKKRKRMRKRLMKRMGYELIRINQMNIIMI